MAPARPEPTLGEVLVEASRRESSYHWAEAADFYRCASDKIDPNTEPTKAGKLAELHGHAQMKRAFQEKTREDFKIFMQKASALFHRAAGLYEVAGEAAAQMRALARSDLASFWSSDDLEERRTLLQQSLERFDGAINALDIPGNEPELAETYRDALTARYYYVWLAPQTSFETCTDKAVEIGEKAIMLYRGLDQPKSQVEPYYLTIDLVANASISFGPTRAKEYGENARKMLTDMGNTASKAQTLETLCYTNLASSVVAHIVEGDCQKAQTFCQKGLKQAKELGDSRLTAWAEAWLSFVYVYLADLEDRIDHRTRILRNLIVLGEEAIKNAEISLDGAVLDVAYTTLLFGGRNLAKLETDPGKKRTSLSSLIEKGTEGMKYNQYSVTRDVEHSLSCVEFDLAKLTDDSDEKTELLKESLAHREDVLHNTLLFSSDHWNVGRDHYAISQIKTEFSEIEKNIENKTSLLKEALIHLDQCVKLCSKWKENPGIVLDNAKYEEARGDILVRLYVLQRVKRIADSAINSYTGAAKTLQESELIGPVPLLWWKSARLLDAVGEYEHAARSFANAALTYRKAGEKNPESKQYYSAYSSYMEAWREIENAKHYHWNGVFDSTPEREHPVRLLDRMSEGGERALSPVEIFRPPVLASKPTSSENPSVQDKLYDLPASPILAYLATEFLEDFTRKRLAIEHAGWRTRTEVVGSIGMPKAQLYGDSRYGRVFGTPLEELIKEGTVEYRIVPGLRGRGGYVVMIRIAPHVESAKKLVDSIA